MTSHETTSRLVPPTGTDIPPENLPVAASPEAEPAGHKRRRFGSMGSGEVGRAILAALLSGVVATGLGWLAADLF